MEYIVHLNSDINNLLNFEHLLSRWKEFKICLRDIKINSILGQKCLYEVEDLPTPLICDFSNNNSVSLNDASITISKLSFKIDTDLTILELKLTYRVLDTKMGKLVSELQNLGIPLTISPKLSKFGTNQSVQVVGFYINNETVSSYIRA